MSNSIENTRNMMLKLNICFVGVGAYRIRPIYNYPPKYLMAIELNPIFEKRTHNLQSTEVTETISSDSH